MKELNKNLTDKELVAYWNEAWSLSQIRVGEAYWIGFADAWEKAIVMAPAWPVEFYQIITRLRVLRARKTDAHNREILIQDLERLLKTAFCLPK